MQEPTESDHFDWQTFGPQSLGQRGSIGVAADQHRCRGRRAVFGTCRLVFFGDLLRNPLTFLFDVSEQRQSNVSGDGSRPRTKCADGHTASAQRCRRQVCQFESLRRVTPTGEQFERRSRLSVGKREVGCKPWQVGRRRASPTVDRLHRIADGCQRQPAVGSPPTVQRGQQHSLSVTGVLVLVEKNYPKALTLGLPDLGMFGGDTGRQRHLAAEIQCAFTSQRLTQPGNEGQ